MIITALLVYLLKLLLTFLILLQTLTDTITVTISIRSSRPVEKLSGINGFASCSMPENERHHIQCLQQVTESNCK